MCVYVCVCVCINSAFWKSLCNYKRCWQWCPRASVQAWTHLILFANTFCRFACEMFLMYAVIAVFNSLTLRRLMSYMYMEYPFLMFLDHTWRSTVGGTPLDEWSARRRDLYLTTHDTHNRQISMPPMGFEPKISAGERPVAAHLLRSWVRIPPGAWIFVFCDCRVLSGRGLCDELITRPEESYRLLCVVVCGLETSRIGAPYIYIYIYDISCLRVNDLTLILLTWRRWWAPNNASK